MKWVLFTGTWKLTNKQVEEDVRQAVRKVIKEGKGVLTGGATGVDYFAMTEALEVVPDGSRLIVIIPSQIDDYIKSYLKDWCVFPITSNDILHLKNVLLKLKTINPNNLIELPYIDIKQEHFFIRDTKEVDMSDEVYAFQVNDSVGTQDTLDKATKKGLPITLHKKYKI